VLVGFALELLTYQIFRNETRKGLPRWIAEIWEEEQLSPTTAQKLIEQCDKLLGLPKTSQGPRLELTPTMLWALVYNLWSKGTENLVDDLDKTITAWSFCRSMSVASIFGLVLVGWAFLRGLPLIGIGSLLGVFLLVLFFDNQRKTVRKAYFRKVIMYSLTL
jgi:hypothetical protein